jgi:hypothetical protein
MTIDWYYIDKFNNKNYRHIAKEYINDYDMHAATSSHEITSHNANITLVFRGCDDCSDHKLPMNEINECENCLKSLFHDLFENKDKYMIYGKSSKDKSKHNGSLDDFIDYIDSIQNKKLIVFHNSLKYLKN